MPADLSLSSLNIQGVLRANKVVCRTLVTGGSRGPTGPAGRPGGFSGGASGSLPYQSSPGVTSFLPIGPVDSFLRCVDGEPEWSTAVQFLGFLESFSGAGTDQAGYLFASTGCKNATEPEDISTTETKFACPVDATIKTITAMWDNGHSDATVSVYVNGFERLATGEIFMTKTGHLCLPVHIPVKAGDMVAVRMINYNCGNTTIGLYFS